MLTFIHISDTHISSIPDYHPHWVHESVSHPNIAVEKLIDAINSLSFEIDFILHTGDVCADPTQEDCCTARDLLGQFNPPVYMIAGNHDSGELMAQHIHDGENLHVVRDMCVKIKGYDLIALDTNGVGDAHAPTVRDAQIGWFADKLFEADKMIVAMHHPLIPTGVDWIDNNMRVQNGEQLHDLLKNHTERLSGVFHGHIHQPTNSYADGVMYVSAPSSWYNLQADPTTQTDLDDLLMPAGFNLVMIRQNRTFIRRYVL